MEVLDCGGPILALINQSKFEFEHTHTCIVDNI